MTYFFIFIIFFCGTFVNIIAPFPGSAMITPLIATLTDPYRAIALTSFYFAMSAVIRLVIFRTSIRWSFVRALLPTSIIGVLIGSLSLVHLPRTIVLSIILTSSVYFLFRKVWSYRYGETPKKTFSFGAPIVGIVSGFLNGTGLPASAVQAGYLYSKGFTIPEGHGTGSTIQIFVYLTAVMTQYGANKVSLSDIGMIATVFPFMVIASLLGKRVLHTFDTKTSDRVIIAIMGVTIILFLLKNVANGII